MASAAPARPAPRRTARSPRSPDPAFPPAARASPDGRPEPLASGAGCGRAESARCRPTRPPLLLPRSNVRHGRDRRSLRTAPPLPGPRRSGCGGGRRGRGGTGRRGTGPVERRRLGVEAPQVLAGLLQLLLVADRAIAVHQAQDRKSTRLNSSHVAISYAVFCLKKKKKKKNTNNSYKKNKN